jgi:surfeit locus 1 family protein
MDRADQKKIINMAFVERQNQPPINLNKETIQMPIKDIIWHHVTLSGEFLNDKNIILDNQIREEKAGFLIYTPFKILNSNKIILINRGWYPLTNSRKDILDIPPIKEMRIIEGQVSQMPSSGISLGKVVTEKLNESSFRLQKMDYEVLSSLISKDLMEYEVKLRKPIFDKTYVVDSGIPVPDSDKNYGYAFQWFAMAFTLFIIFIRLGVKKK